VVLLEKEQIDLLLKFAGIIVLVIVVLFILTWAGVVKCSTLSPVWCEVYDSVVGSPSVLIVYGDEGLGDPEKLKMYLQDPRYVGVLNVSTQEIDRVTMGNLKRYKLVIVEHSRKVSADQLLMFMEYVNKNGGRLVWIGDAGVEYGDGEVREISDINTGSKIADNPWVRVKETDVDYKLISFDEFLGLKYLDNYCNQKDCLDAPFSVGSLESEPTGDHPLIFGTAPVLNFKISKERNFSVVKPLANSYSSNIVLTLNFGGNIKGKEYDLGKSVPIITTSSIGVGERVAYYAYPPEWFVEDNNYFYYVKNMYKGMFGR
jgi:hypothetical protein